MALLLYGIRELINEFIRYSRHDTLKPNMLRAFYNSVQ